MTSTIICGLLMVVLQMIVTGCLYKSYKDFKKDKVDFNTFFYAVIGVSVLIRMI